MRYPHEFSTISNFVTVSQGVVSVNPTGRETLSDIYEAVDKALYQAKTQGRNRYVVKQVIND
jgi:diguanylate cyclase (GGDEF)-like protein